LKKKKKQEKKKKKKSLEDLKIETNRFNNQIFVNTISQICENMVGKYSLGHYYALNRGGF
jgi:hydroxymethylglutaryl-CoA reductase